MTIFFEQLSSPSYTFYFYIAMNTEQTTAITALAVAAVALLVAIGQILGQYFNTADGYRRCQETAVGGWAKNTRRRFRWSQLRFEVLYTTPHIGIYAPEHYEGAHVENHLKSLGLDYRKIDGSRESIESTFSDPINVDKATSKTHVYRVSWIPLIECLHDVHRLYRSSAGQFRGPSYKRWEKNGYFDPALSTPYIEPREQTWDMMPPDLLRPAASASLGNIIVLAHRLGMGWREIRIGTGVLHAEGYGQAISGSMSRGIGILVQYTRDKAFDGKRRNTPWERLVIPSVYADMLGFGIIPGGLGIPDLSLQADDGSLSEIDNTMSVLRIQSSEQSKIRQRWIEDKSFVGFSDVVALVPPFLPIMDSSITTVHRPLPDLNGPLICREGREAFRVRLHHELSGLREPENSGILPQLMDLSSRLTLGFDDWSEEWSRDGEGKTMRNNRDVGLLNFLRHQHAECTNSLRKIFEDASTNGFPFTFRDLVGAHLSQATSAYIQASTVDDENSSGGLSTHFPTPPNMDHHLYQAFHIYVDNLPRIVERVKTTCDPEIRTIRTSPFPRLRVPSNDIHGDPPFLPLFPKATSLDSNLEAYTTSEKNAKIRLAWWLMIFRAQCWYLSVSLIGPLDGSSNGRGGIIVPSSLWDSQVLVHIV